MFQSKAMEVVVVLQDNTGQAAIVQTATIVAILVLPHPRPHAPAAVLLTLGS